jgi:rod shape-determining protein MreD
VKRFLLILIAYLLAMVQLGARGWFPNLLLLLVITAAVFEERNFALVVGFLAGLFIDAGNPQYLGLNMMVYLLVAYGITLVRRLVYERIVYLFIFGALALLIRYGLNFLLSHQLPVLWQMAVASIATLVLLVPVYRLVKSLFNYQWKVA